jgi:drug/metabolite transporter (DMT)-like permease
MTKNSLQNFLLLIALGFCWGPSFLFIRFAIAEVPPLTLVSLRLIPAALLLWLIVFASGEKPREYTQCWRHFLIMGFLSCVFPFACISASELSISSSLAAIINSTTPLFTAIGAHFLIGERLTQSKILGILCGFLGILAVFVPSLLDQHNNSEWGALLVLLASISYAAAYLYTRTFLSHVPSMLGAASQVLAAALLVLPAALIFDHPWELAMPSLPALLGIAGLALFGTAIAFAIYYKLNKSAGPTYTSTSTLLFPAIAVLLGVLVLDEKLSWNIILGCFIIFTGLAIAHGFIKFPRKYQRTSEILKHE